MDVSEDLLTTHQIADGYRAVEVDDVVTVTKPSGVQVDFTCQTSREWVQYGIGAGPKPVS